MMDSKDKKDFAAVVGEVIDQKVTPRLVKLEAGQKKLEEQNSGIMEQVAKNSEDVEMIKEDFQDMGYVIERIETKLDASIRRQDDASIKTSQLHRRVLKLETKKA